MTKPEMADSIPRDLGDAPASEHRLYRQRSPVVGRDHDTRLSTVERSRQSRVQSHVASHRRPFPYSIN